MTTDLPVRDIGMEIGQQSLGTFTTRFSSSIGLTPAKFRHYARQRRENYLEQLSHLTTWHLNQLDFHLHDTVVMVYQTLTDEHVYVHKNGWTSRYYCLSNHL